MSASIDSASTSLCAPLPYGGYEAGALSKSSLALLDLINNVEAVTEILADYKFQLTPQQADSLHRICRHFLGGVASTIKACQDNLTGLIETDEDVSRRNGAEPEINEDVPTCAAQSRRHNRGRSEPDVVEDAPARAVQARHSRNENHDELDFEDNMGPRAAHGRRRRRNEPETDEDAPPRANKARCLDANRHEPETDEAIPDELGVWKPIRKLPFTLSRPIEQHIQDHGTDPFAFINESGPNGEDGLFADADESTHVINVWNWMMDLEVRTTKDKARMCFAALFCFDLARYIRPGSVSRVSRSMREEMTEYLSALQDVDFDIANMCGTIEECNNMGKRIDFLCEQFGPGCIFYLSDILSKNFVLNKMTMRGPSWTAALAYMNSHMLKDKAESSRANELATKIRSSLRGKLAR